MRQIHLYNGAEIYINGGPNLCPECHRTITPGFVLARESFDELEVVCSCPNIECNKMFIAYYEEWASAEGHEFTGRTSIGTLVTKTFSDEITAISPLFVKIYNQAFTAEQQNLLEICGVGYRKALEFLIKDYLILNNEDEKERIKSKLLWPCIKDYVTDNRIKSVAQRAVWLGNDETHYVRKWDGKDLQDLKKLIDLTIHWIEMELLTRSFEEDMPE